MCCGLSRIEVCAVPCLGGSPEKLEVGQGARGWAGLT